ncbi:hypothetical protein QJS10_CPB17g00345 [Acorus calamus]|uniref:Uncharacterized protein n=1 Tax=Acorus calamus TaxID=4465 RepID=A0AAV9CWB7_ACOCL|nr:hypothetical protein QJS10_CPB17g00345 [Acorus calamus]
MKSAPTTSKTGSDKSTIQLKFGAMKPGPAASKNESEKGHMHSNHFSALQEENLEEDLVNGEINEGSMEEEQISNRGTAIHSVASQCKAGSTQEEQISKGGHAINALKISSPHKVLKGDCIAAGMVHAQDTSNIVEGELVVDLSHSDSPVATDPLIANPAPVVVTNSAPIPLIAIVEPKTDQRKTGPRKNKQATNTKKNALVHKKGKAPRDEPIKDFFRELEEVQSPLDSPLKRTDRAMQLYQ